MPSLVGWATSAIEHLMYGLLCRALAVRAASVDRSTDLAVGAGSAILFAMSSPDATPTKRIVRLVGVYDADSTVRGELAYWVGAHLGRRHCALCDITHGSVRQRPEWTACQAALPVQFDTYHRNDQPSSVRAAANGSAPVVVAETDTGHVVLLVPSELDTCKGSIDRLVEAIEQSALRLGLTWATE